MATRIVKTAPKLVLFATLVASSGLTKSAVPVARELKISPAAFVAELPTEVRVRRLHLVRPDLIRYPIAYEVIC